MTCKRISNSTANSILSLLAIALGLTALLPTASAQQPAAKATQPATVEEAARVIDLRTWPRMEGARVVLRSLGTLMYSAKGSLKQAFDFQQQELTKRGFKELPGRSSHASGESSHFTKDGFLVAVSTSPVTGDPQRPGWSEIVLVSEGNVALDKLPVPPGAKPFHPTPREASYTTTASPAETTEACRKLLLAAGWEPYGHTAPSANAPEMTMHDFKRNAVKIQSWIMTTPAEGGKTLIRYSAELLSADLPAPPDAIGLRYDDYNQRLTFEAPETQAAAILAFYQERLPKLGWKATTERPIVDDRQRTQFLIFRNPQKELLSLDLAIYSGKLNVKLSHQSAEEVAAEEEQAKAAAEIARKEQERKNMRITVAVPLPAKATKLQKKSPKEWEYSLPTGSGPAAMELHRQHFRGAGWTELKGGREFGATSGSMRFEKDGDQLSFSYFDIGFGEVDIAVEGSERIVLAAGPAIALAAAESPKAGAKAAAPAIPGLPPGLDLPVDVNEIVKKALEEANSLNPSPAKKAAAPKGKQGANPAAEEPLIPGLPALPPGIDLPPEAKAFLKKGLQDAAKQKEAAANKAKQVASKATPKGASPTKGATVARPRAAAATTFKRVAVEKSLGSVGDLDLIKFTASKPHFWISPDGRRFAYLIDKGIVIDGKEHKYQTNVKEKTICFSPDSRRVAYVVNLDQGETLILDGKPEPKGWNFIANHEGAVFSPDSQHVAYTARRYVGGGVEYVLMIDGNEREVFKESPAWAMSFTSDSRRVVWGEHVGERTLMRETSVDGSQPRIERTHGPSLMTINFFFGGGGQMGYVAHDANGHFIFYDNKEEPLRFENEIRRRDILLSTDGKHLAYVAEPKTFRRVVVMDGKPSPEYGGLEADYVKDTLAISPVGGRWAYAIKKRNEQFAVIDGKPGKAYRSVGGLTFSPDGQRVAYQAQLANKLIVVVDGREGPGFDELGKPVFSPDGKSVAVAAGAGPKKFIVVSGQPQQAYADVSSPAYAPASNRLVYRAEIETDGQWLLHDGGRESKPYDVIEPDLYFSEGGKHLATVVLEGVHQMVIVDGVEGNRYDTILTIGGGRVHFDDQNRFHYLAAKGTELFLVEETIQP